jgi:L-amino acid N-acyltransferase YncA
VTEAQGYLAVVPVRIRDTTAADVEAIADIYRTYVDESAVSFEEVAPDAGEILRRMHAAPRLPWLTADSDGGLLGYAYSSMHRQRAGYRWSVDCSVYLKAGEGGRGIGRLLYTELLTLLRGLGYYRAYAGIALPNDASVGLHEAMGFVPVGVYEGVGFTQGAWHDVGWWQLSLRPAGVGDGAPEEPKRWRPSKEV